MKQDGTGSVGAFVRSLTVESWGGEVVVGDTPAAGAR